MAKSVLKIIFIILYLLFSIILYAENNQPLLLNQNQDKYFLEPYLEIYFDPTQKISLDEIINPPLSNKFIPVSKLKKYRFYDVTTWVKFSIENPLANKQFYLLGSDVPNRAGNVTLFKIENKKAYQIPSPPASKHLILFEINLKPGEKNTYLTNYYTNTFSNKYLGYYIEKPYSYILKAIDHYLFLGLIIGVSIALLIQAIFLFFFLEEYSYLAYSAFIFAGLVATFINSGLHNHLIYADSGDFTLFLLRFDAIAGAFIFVIFTKMVMRTKQYAPRMNKILNYFLIAAIPICYFSLTRHHANRLTIINDLKAYDPLIYLVIGNILSLISGIIIDRRGYVVARYYLTGMLCLLSGYILFFLSDIAILPDIFIFRQAPIIGISLDTILQATALAVKVNLIEISKIKILQETILRKDAFAKIKNQLILDDAELIKAYARFFPSRFLEALNKKRVTEINLGDQIKTNMTLLFLDINPIIKNQNKLIDTINHQLKKIGPCIRNYHGFVEKYGEDSLLALFTHPIDSIKAGIEIYKSAALENIKLEFGMHNGFVALGTIGETKRMDCTVISDTVNIASRLQFLNAYYQTQILVTEDILKNISHPDELCIRFVDNIILKGKTKSFKIFEIFNIDTPELIHQKLNSLTIYNNAIQYFFNNEIKQALALFLQCKQLLAKDYLINLYIDRCHLLIKNKIPAYKKISSKYLEKIELHWENLNPL